MPRRADTWLAMRRIEVVQGLWNVPAPAAKPLTFGEYAETWLSGRTLKPRTVAHYRMLLDKHLLPTFGGLPLNAIAATSVVRWHTAMGTDHPTLRSHAYGLLRSVLTGAVQDSLIAVNPAHIRGASNSTRVHKVRPATPAQIATLTDAMPAKHKLMVILAAWCALRYGELTELRRKDIDLKEGTIRVERAVVRVNGKVVIGLPKSDAGMRDVAIPPHILPLL